MTFLVVGGGGIEQMFPLGRDFDSDCGGVVQLDALDDPIGRNDAVAVPLAGLRSVVRPLEALERMLGSADRRTWSKAAILVLEPIIDGLVLDDRR